VRLYLASIVFAAAVPCAAAIPTVVPAGASIAIDLPGEVAAQIADGADVRVSDGVQTEVAGDVVRLTWPTSGRTTTSLRIADARGAVVFEQEVEVRVLPGALTLLPPLLAIVLALALREVVLALFGGIYAGSLLLMPHPLAAAGDALGRSVSALADPDRASIVVFSLMLGGMVGIIQRNGGTRGIVEALSSRARSRVAAQITTWALGLVIFFDDYANSLLLGTTMRPLTDRMRISREKLAFLVDSTAAPVASIALFSTWIGFELDQIASATGLDDSATYLLFLESIAYRFYPVLMLLFIPMMVAMRRDFGPMLQAERRAITTGELLRPGAVPASDFESAALAPPDDRPGHWIDAALPIASVVVATCLSLWLTGRAGVLADGGQLTLRTILGNADSYASLLWAAFTGCLVAAAMSVLRRRMAIREVMSAWTGGLRSMLVAFIILILAAAIGQLCKDLYVPEYTVALLGDTMPSAALPAAVFLVACLASLATGSSWSTIAILTPLVAPLAVELASRADLDSHHALVTAIAAILAGAIFGDHCSPISDTTVLSSMASSCDHVDHVRTQAPIAIVVATVSIVIGSGGVALGLPIYLIWPLALAVLYGFLRSVGTTVEEPAGLP